MKNVHTKTSCCKTVYDGGQQCQRHLSPALALRRVELQTQQSSSDHAEPVDVDHVICILVLVAKNTRR